MTQPTDDVPWDTLAAYLAGELPGEERARVQAWLVADPRHEELAAFLGEVWAGSAANRRRYDAEAMLQRVKRHHPAPLEHVPESTRERRRPERRFSPTMPSRARAAGRMLLAASIAAVAAGGWWVASQLEDGADRGAPTQVAAHEYRTTRGQRLALRLADGSSVMLGPASVLRVDPAYGDEARAVALDGEAYFEVTHDEARPFSVRTATAVARDLGTRFVVRAYPDEPATDVVVAEGLVALGRGAAATGDPLSSDSLLLEPGHRGSVTGAGELVHARRVDLDSYFGWTEGRLVFRDTPLPEALRRIGRWYDIDVRLAGTGLRDRTLSATFRDEPAAEAVRLVAASFGLRVEREGAAYVLRAAPE